MVDGTNYTILAVSPLFVSLRHYKDTGHYGRRVLGPLRIALDFGTWSLILEWIN